MTGKELTSISARLETIAAPLILRWAVERFGEDLVATSSFQTQSMPLLHLMSRIAPGVPFIFLDTGFHFPETLAFRDRVAREFGIKVENHQCLLGTEGFRMKYGDLWKQDVSMCCYLNKVEPLERALEGKAAWITGIRRDQTNARREAPIVERDRNGRIKICPMAPWTRAMTEKYIEHHRLPRHPLNEMGYRSIGCRPCTMVVAKEKDERAGRWGGGKTECGLHFDEDGRHDEIRKKLES